MKLFTWPILRSIFFMINCLLNWNLWYLLVFHTLGKRPNRNSETSINHFFSEKLRLNTHWWIFYLFAEHNSRTLCERYTTRFFGTTQKIYRTSNRKSGIWLDKSATSKSSFLYLRLYERVKSFLSNLNNFANYLNSQSTLCSFYFNHELLSPDSCSPTLLKHWGHPRKSLLLSNQLVI